MKVLKQPSLYQCEICGAIYRHKSFAVFCENLPLYETDYKIGDTVYVDTKSHGLAKSTIAALKTVPPIGLEVEDKLCAKPSIKVKESLNSHYMVAVLEDYIRVASKIGLNDFYIQELRKKE